MEELKNKFYLNQIFLDEYPVEAVEFCSDKYHIEEIEKDENNRRRFKIIENNFDISLEEKIQNYKFFLSQTDWYVTRKIETGKKIPEDISEKRKEARDEISKLVEENEDLKQYL